MPGIDCTSSSALRRPPVRLEIVPPVATSRTRGTSCARAAAGASKAISATPSKALFRRRMHVSMKRIQVPVEKGPDPIPGIALLARVLGLPGLRVHAAVEGVAARRVVVDHRLRQPGLAGAQRVDQLHVFL